MPVRELRGYKPGHTMPAHVRGALGAPKPFGAVHHVFMARAASEAGTDHDIPNEPPCFDQGGLGSCVLNAVVGCGEIVLAVEGLPQTMLARLFLYFLCNLAQGTPDQDDGTFVHLAVERAGTIGVCPEAMWPYGDDAFIGKKPAPECYPAASDNRPTAWFQIDDGAGDAELAQLESAVRSNHPVAFGLDVDSKIRSYRKGQILTAPDPNDIIGGHAMVVVGVRFIGGRRVWRIRNSWGTDYGDDGHLLVDDAFMRKAEDRWVLTRIDALLF